LENRVESRQKVEIIVLYSNEPHPYCPQIEDQYLKIRQNSKQFNQNEKSFEKIQKSKPNKYICEYK